MMRIRSSRSVCATTSRRRRSDIPTDTNRCSPAEWPGSDIVSDRGSPRTVAASRKPTPCLARLACALSGSHSNARAIDGIYDWRSTNQQSATDVCLKAMRLYSVSPTLGPAFSCGSSISGSVSAARQPSSCVHSVHRVCAGRALGSASCRGLFRLRAVILVRYGPWTPAPRPHKPIPFGAPRRQQQQRIRHPPESPRTPARKSTLCRQP